MGIRLGLIGALAALALALARVSRLVESGPGQPPLIPLLLIATVIGVVINQAIRTFRLGLFAQALVGALGSLLLVARLTAPDTLFAGLIPTEGTAAVVGAEMTVAAELIRFGSAPVAASPGLVAVLAVVFWTLGAIAVGALASRRYLLATVPALAFYLLAATFDRRPPGWWHPLGLIVCGGLAFLAATESGTGGRVRLAGSSRPLAVRHRLLPALFVALVALSGTFATFRFASAVPESGMVAWRNPTGFGASLFGGFSYNLFASMQQDLADDSPEILFLARVSDSGLPDSALYWKLISLDTFDGNYWLPANLDIIRPAGPNQWESVDFQFQGPEILVESVIRIEALRQNYLPVLYSPRSVESNDSLVMDSYRTREDGSLKFDARTQPGLIYRVTSEIPVPDLAVLATSGGELSPLFARAQAEGVFNLPATNGPGRPTSGRISTVYTELPDDFPESVAGLARQVTAQTSTDFERGLLLEEFLRSTGGFVYDASASSGHSSLAMEDWLLVPESRNYRRGYCEQFASTMAVMARALGIPARVVIGFSPGTVQTQEDGSEVIVVRARNGHAWVELFIEDQGWIRFDPTPRSDGSNLATVEQIGFEPTAYLPSPGDPGEIPLQLPGSIDTIDRRFLEPEFDVAGGEGGTGVASSFDYRWLLPIALVLIVPLSKAIRRRSRLVRLTRGDLAAGWAEFSDRLTDLGWSLSASSTPLEIARHIDEGGAGTMPLAERVTAQVFGNREIADGRSALQMAERSLRSRFRAWRWWLTWFAPATLWARLKPWLTPRSSPR